MALLEEVAVSAWGGRFQEFGGGGAGSSHALLREGVASHVLPSPSGNSRLPCEPATSVCAWGGGSHRHTPSRSTTFPLGGDGGAQKGSRVQQKPLWAVGKRLAPPGQGWAWLLCRPREASGFRLPGAASPPLSPSLSPAVFSVFTRTPQLQPRLGQDVVLDCGFSAPASPFSVEWRHQHRGAGRVILAYDGAAKRVTVAEEGLELFLDSGGSSSSNNVSLRLRGLGVRHEGTYICTVYLAHLHAQQALELKAVGECLALEQPACRPVSPPPILPPPPAGIGSPRRRRLMGSSRDLEGGGFLWGFSCKKGRAVGESGSVWNISFPSNIRVHRVIAVGLGAGLRLWGHSHVGTPGLTTGLVGPFLFCSREGGQPRIPLMPLPLSPQSPPG